MPDIDWEKENLRLTKALTAQEVKINDLTMRLNSVTASYNEAKGQIKAWKETVDLMINSLMRYRNNEY